MHRFRKRIKRFFSELIPAGKVKERLKCKFYNLANPDCIFEIETGVYIMKKEGVFVKGHQDFYSINTSVNRYLSFYKPRLGDFVLDAGSHVGQLSLYFSALVGREGRIFSFEPDDLNRRSQNENLKVNSDLSSQIEIDARLLWDSEKDLYFEELGGVASSVGSSDALTSVKKKSTSIDLWIEERRIDHLDFVKMDIEGAEIEAILGAEKTIRTLTPNFAIASYHVVRGAKTYKWLEEYFGSIRYPFKTVFFNDGEIITYAGPAIDSRV